MSPSARARPASRSVAAALLVACAIAPAAAGQVTLSEDLRLLDASEPCAALAADGDTLILGVPEDDELADNSGAAIVYVRSGPLWTREQRLTASTAGEHLRFGRAVALEGDTAVITGAGEVFVFTRTAGTWSEDVALSQPDAGGGDDFGESVDLSGNRFVVGAWLDDEPLVNSGSAYVYRRDASWTFEQKLTPSVQAMNARFGVDVAIEGERVLVGAFQEPAVGTDSGAAYVFHRPAASWTEQQRLLPAGLQAGDLFGHAVELDGGRAFVGAYETNGAANNEGSVFEWALAGSTWSVSEVVKAPDAAGGDHFGIALSVDGDRMLVGANLVDEPGVNNSGAAYTFVRTEAGWSAERKLGARLPASEAQLGRFGALAGEVATMTSRLFPDAFVFTLDKRFCFGTACPCGNDDSTGGCRNSTGGGARLDAALTSSLTADDLILIATGLPPRNLGLFVMSSAPPPPLQVGDGLLCVGGPTAHRFAPALVALDGTLSLTQPVSGAPPGSFASGELRYFQAFARDAFCPGSFVPCPSPCAGGVNLSNAVGVLFVP